MDRDRDLLPGSLDMLILKAASLRPLHGFGVLLRIAQISNGSLHVPQGSLYSTLYRLEHQRLISAEWGETEKKRRAKCYTLAPAGRRRLEKERASWDRLAAAMNAKPSEVSYHRSFAIARRRPAPRPPLRAGD